MREIKLLPHNEVAYERLVNCLEFNQMVAINHATGTGKSFIILKYLYKNKDKRILYLAPTYQIIDQLLENHTDELGINVNEFNRLDTSIYSNLLEKDMQKLASEYDIIILDEYHRCGALKWGEKVNELLEILKNNYPDKKVIGTTATEIRFLDDEKNMNNILFDGVCASRLTLVDAILQGILPVPVYTNATYELYEILEKIEKRIKKKCFYNINLNKYLKLIIDLRLELELSLKEINNLGNFYKENGKFLVFSSTLKNIEKDKQTIRKIFKDNIANEFEVHCKKPKAKNKQILDNFRNINEGNNFLYSVNVLNEGLHVKDVDALFMFRKTTSPIIYFQQLGRLLSYSKRKDTVYVFDLVNNIKNHPYIYYLYQELTRRAQELMEIYPEKAEYYQNIIDKFKVINLTSNICEKINTLSDMAKISNLRKERLNTAILILENKLPSSFIEKIQAQIDIFKYKDIIDIEAFNKIKELNIKKPKIFNLNEIEYELYLKDEKFNKKFERENKDENLTIVQNEVLFRKSFELILFEVEEELKKYKTKEEYIKKIYKDLLNFIKENYRSPKIKDNDDETKLFFKKIIFYNELEKLGYIDSLKEEEIEVNKINIVNEYIEFSKNHRGELPSIKIDNEKEKSLARRIKQIEPVLNKEELILINELRKKQLIRLKGIIDEYISFIQTNKRYPLEDSKDEKERNLFISYLRCEELMTKEEKAMIKTIVLKSNKKNILQNTYIEMIKNRK